MAWVCASQTHNLGVICVTPEGAGKPAPPKGTPELRTHNKRNGNAGKPARPKRERRQASAPEKETPAFGMALADQEILLRLGCLLQRWVPPRSLGARPGLACKG